MLRELLGELLGCEELEKEGQLLSEETESIGIQELVLGRDKELLEALFDVLIRTSEVSDIVSEVKAETGSEAKVGVELLHSDIVVMSDAIGAVSVLHFPR